MKKKNNKLKSVIDPIIEESRHNRRDFMSEYNNDAVEIFKELKEIQNQSPNKNLYTSKMQSKRKSS